MQRRTVLVVLGTGLAAGGLAGCLGDGAGGQTVDSPTESPIQTPRETENRGPYEMSEGTVIVEVTVDSEYDGDVVLDGKCRDGELVLTGAEHASIERRQRGESCAVTVDIGGETVFDSTVSEFASYSLAVGEDGDLSSDVVLN